MSAATLDLPAVGYNFRPQVAATTTKAKLIEDDDMKPWQAFAMVMGSIVAVFGLAIGVMAQMEHVRPDGFNSALTNAIGTMVATTVTALIGFAALILKTNLIAKSTSTGVAVSKDNNEKLKHLHDCVEKKAEQITNEVKASKR